MKRLFRLDVLLVVVVPLVDSLAVAVGAETGNFAGLVDIGSGRKMYLKCSGRGSPTVVLVGGLRASADDWDISDKSKPTVFTGVGKFTRVCACDRPGTPVGEKPSPQRPRPAADHSEGCSCRFARPADRRRRSWTLRACWALVWRPNR
jgi:hypothetical protein